MSWAPNLFGFSNPLESIHSQPQFNDSSTSRTVKKGNKFEWTPSHQAAFEIIKSKITEKTTLAYYDPANKIVLQVDASMRGNTSPMKANLLFLPAKS